MEILSALRTPIGSFCGGLSTLQAHDLGALVIKEAVAKAGLAPDQVSEVIFGQVLTAGHGQNPVRQAAVNAGLPVSVPATMVNMLCGSGLRSVILGAQSIRMGDASVVVAGGQESMSQAHHSVHLRTGIKMGNGSMVDTMIADGLTDAFKNIHMGITGTYTILEFLWSRSSTKMKVIYLQRRMLPRNTQFLARNRMSLLRLLRPRPPFL